MKDLAAEAFVTAESFVTAGSARALTLHLRGTKTMAIVNAATLVSIIQASYNNASARKRSRAAER